MPRLKLLIILLLFCISPCLVLARGDLISAAPVKIGVLAKRGTKHCLTRWSPTAEYLASVIKDKKFKIVPLDFSQIYPSVENRQVDFILANPSFYVELEVKLGVRRIATLKNWTSGAAFSQFAGVIFVRSQRSDITKLADFRGETYMGVKKTSLGGFQMFWLELKEQGLDPYRFLKSIEFGGTHDQVVYAVRDSLVDIGNVRTDTLERMAREGKINLSEYRIINVQAEDKKALPFHHSTRPYPEWPMAKVKHTPVELAERIATALLAMPVDSEAAKAANCAGWTIPMNYQPVHHILRELRLSPYELVGQITLADVFSKYWPIISLMLLLFLIVVGAALVVLRINRRYLLTLRELQVEIKERQKVEEALMNSHAELDQIFNTAVGGMRVIDLNFTMVRCNDTFSSMCGLPAQELVGKKCYEIFPGEKCDTSDCPMTSILAGSEMITEEVVKRSPDNREIPCSLVVKPFRDRNGNIVGIIEDFYNISERKEYERKLLQQKERETKQSAMAHSGRMAALGEMATAMAHEIHQPLSVISIQVQAWSLLEKKGKLTKDHILGQVGKIMNNVKRIADLIDHVRTFGRIEKEMKRVDINGIIKNAISLCRHQLKAHAIELKEEYASDLPLLMATPTELEQVFINLLANARFAVEENMKKRKISPYIKIRTIKRSETIIVFVEDNGDGVLPGKEELIFDPFYTTKTSSEGTGLGLDICSRILKKYRGGIKLHNRPGKGATFEIWLSTLDKQNDS